MENKFNFGKPFAIYIDGEEVQDVSVIHITRNCNENDNEEQNRATLHYQVNGKMRVLTAGIDALSFKNI